MPTLHLDFETRSPVTDLDKTGVYIYARHPDTDIWCACYAIDDGPIQTWRPEVPVPGDLLSALADPDVTLAGHNVGFEWHIIEYIAAPRYGWPRVDPERLDCTAVRAAVQSLPRNLGGAAQALGLAVEKDDAGRRLMLQMCKPRKPRKSEDPDALLWWDDEDRRQRLEAYCRRDVEVERELDRVLEPLSGRERKLWMLDFKINQRGVHVDLDLVNCMNDVLQAALKSYDRELSALTDYAVGSTTDINALRAWVGERLGAPLDSLDKNIIRDLLAGETDLPAEVRRALEIRSEAGKASTAKLRAFQRRTGEDGRMRENLLHHGAGTGRWSGRGVQLQNMPRPKLSKEAIEQVVSIVKDQSMPASQRSAMIEWLFGPVPTILSSCLRACVCAAPGKKFLVADYANIEGRVNAWAAGQEDKIALFAADGPIYERMAAEIYQIPAESVAKGSEQRHLGKTAELGCFEAGTSVLCRDRHQGTIHAVSIECVDPQIYEVWDGVEWVIHLGPIYQGEKTTISLAGVGVTPGHRVWCGGTWHRAKVLARNGSIRSQALATALESCRSWGSRSALGAGLSQSASVAPAGAESTALIGAIYGEVAQRGATAAPGQRGGRLARNTGGMRTSSLTRATGAVCSTGLRPVSSAATTHDPASTRITVGAGSTSSGLGARIGGCFSAILSGWKGGTVPSWSWTGPTWTEAMSQATCGLSHGARTRRISAGSRNSRSGLPRSKPRTPVYDIALAGPRSRFTILTDSGPLIVHNCGYQMGAPKFQSTCEDAGIRSVDADMAKHTVDTYRRVNDKIVKQWYGLEEAALQAMRAPGSVASFRYVQFHLTPDQTFLVMILPGGRRLYYPSPQLREKTTPWGALREQVTYMGTNQITRQWERQDTYGGKLTENAVQAIARDILASAMYHVEQAGMDIVLTVHDEIVAEVDEDSTWSLADLERIMEQPPKFADGCPIAVEGYAGQRFSK